MAAAPNFNNPNRWTGLAAAAAQNYRPPPPPRPAPPNPFNNPNRWTGLAAAAAQNPHMWQQLAENPHGDGTATLTPQQVGLGGPAHPPAAAAPTAPPPAPGTPAQSQGPSPLDSTYMANVAANQFKVNNDINGLGLEGSQNDTRLQDTLGALAYQQPRDQLALEQKANQSGGLYSSVYDQNLGNLTHGFAMKQAEAQRSHDSARDTIAAKIAALQGGVPLYNDQQAAAATGRSARLAANDPGLGQGTGGLNTNPSPAPTVQSFTAGKQWRQQPGDNGFGKPAPAFNNPNRWTSLAAAAAKNPNMWVQRLAEQNRRTAATNGGNPRRGY